MAYGAEACTDLRVIVVGDSEGRVHLLVGVEAARRRSHSLVWSAPKSQIPATHARALVGVGGVVLMVLMGYWW